MAVPGVIRNLAMPNSRGRCPPYSAAWSFGWGARIVEVDVQRDADAATGGLYAGIASAPLARNRQLCAHWEHGRASIWLCLTAVRLAGWLVAPFTECQR